MNSSNLNQNYIIIGIIVILFIVICLFAILYNKNYSETFSCKTNNVSEEEYIPNNQYEIVLYYADWCGHSKIFLPEWEKFENHAKNNFKHLKVTKIKCEGNNINLCKQKNINGYPTIKLYMNGKEIEYNNERNLQGLINFIHNHK
ncbi:Thioredoxin [uncultured virus]|nr:Thioredoxin [uncultured virus]